MAFVVYSKIPSTKPDVPTAQYTTKFVETNIEVSHFTEQDNTNYWCKYCIFLISFKKIFVLKLIPEQC